MEEAFLRPSLSLTKPADRRVKPIARGAENQGHADSISGHAIGGHNGLSEVCERGESHTEQQQRHHDPLHLLVLENIAECFDHAAVIVVLLLLGCILANFEGDLQISNTLLQKNIRLPDHKSQQKYNRNTNQCGHQIDISPC